MIELELTFNPYKTETSLKVGEHDAPKDLIKELCGPDGEELSSWVGSFWGRAVNQYNDNISLTFNGILRDYEFLEDSLIVFSDKEPGSKLKKGKITKSEDRLQILKDLFVEMQKETPFAILRDDSLKQLFDRATNSEFEMAAVATMSSGKSTIINSILGEDLLPARNDATTATIARIHGCNELTGYRARATNVEGKTLKECNPLSKKEMEELNSLPGTAYIEIYGNIPGIKSQTLSLCLTDTPGPNNSQTEEHQKHTYRLLEDEFKPMVLYILNATQLEINDDATLLEHVATAMKTGGRQSRDRFIFVLNKADNLDPEKDGTLPQIIDKCRKYLAKFGIKEPRIFPTAAQLAKVLRQAISGLPMTMKEEDDILPRYNSFIKREALHFSEWAPLSPVCKELQTQMMDKAKETDNKYELALIYTGIPAIELAISEYLEKYALPVKIAKGVESFKTKIANLKIEADTLDRISKDEKELEKLCKTIEELKSILSKKDMALDVKKRIESLSVAPEIENTLVAARADMMKTMRTTVQSMKKRVLATEAQKSINSLKNSIASIQTKFTVSIEKVMNDVLCLQAQQCIEDYSKYVESILGSIECPELAQIVLERKPISVDEVMQDYVMTVNEKVGTRTERVQIGSHVVVEDSNWHGGPSIRGIIAGLFGKKSFLGKSAPRIEYDYENVERDIYADREYVELGRYIDDKIIPLTENFLRETSQFVSEVVNQQTKNLKTSFISKLVNLEQAIKKKIEDLENALQDAEKREKAIENNKNNLEWLNNFIQKLDDLLMV